MAKEDISDLLSKIDNHPDDPEGKLTAQEFVRLVRAVRQNQNSVMGISVNGNTPQTPDAEGTVRLTIDLTGAEYKAYLMVEQDPNLPIVVSSKDCWIGVRFTGAYMDGVVPRNYGANGRLTVRVNGEDKAVLDVPSLEYDEHPSSYYPVNIGPYLKQDETVVVQLRAAFDYEDMTGNMQTMNTQGYVTFSSVTYTEVGLEFAGDYNAPLTNPTVIPLNYHLKGSVARKLHVRITGGTREYEHVFSIGANEYTNYLSTWKDTDTVADASQYYGFLSGGIITIEAWLTYSDGTQEDVNSTDHVINQLMVVTSNVTDTPRLLIQNLIKKTENYVQTEICSYAVYAPGRDSIAVSFAIRNNSQTQDYLNMEVLATPGTPYHLNGSVGIESTDLTLYAYFYAYIIDRGTTYTFASGEVITVDNKENFAPTNGADFYLNPSTRSNAEGTPLSIVNAVGNVLVPSTWSNFGAINDAWVQDEDNQRVLRVLAGQLLTINYDWLSPFANNAAANVTLELDFKVRNVTNEDDPVFQACEAYGDGFIGLKMRPLEGSVWTSSNRTELEQNFSWQEGERTHVVINIVSALRASTDNNASTLALCRVFINGCINREFIFDKDTAGTWYSRGSSIVIGQAGADIDIFALRVYKNQALDSADILQNYRSTMPTAAQKVRVRDENDLLGNTGLISLNKCQERKKNCLIWHCAGGQIRRGDTATKTGWWEIHQYDDNGNELLDYSGSLCRETASVEQTGQGSTAKTYYYWNLQSKLKDVAKAYDKELSRNGLDAETVTLEQTAELCPHGIWVEITKIHPDYSDFTPSTARNGYAFVPDGWVDGNGMYRGPQYKLMNGVPYAQKLVAKINYASSMQSHLMGACNLYNDLHQSIVGRNVMQVQTSGARVAKCQNVFLYFLQEGETAVYQGPCTFGPGKMDDGTWGFNKKKHPNFVMLEGADNDLPLTDFRVPWQSDRISYEIEDGEAAGFIYNGYTSLDLDKFVAQTITIDGNEVEVPSSTILNHIKQFVNFLYKHNPRIKYFSGTKTQFEASAAANDVNYLYWWTEGAGSYKLMRYDFFEGKWVDYGWDETNEVVEECDLTAVGSIYRNAYVSHPGNFEAMNAGFIAAVVEDARSKIGNIINVDSLKFHYCFTNWMICGSDNCSKNTYYCLVPYGDASADKSTWEWKWELHQDDQDTIFKTDNSGFQTKPYYIDRLHPCAEGSTESLYRGNANVLFNLTEELYESNGELRSMFQRIFTTMSGLVSVSDDLPLSNNQKTTPWGCMWKYFFKIQRYIPAVAYNEAARIRYEYPASVHFISERGVDPITQSMGDQLEAEVQYMKRRLVLLASYAEWGDFSLSSGNVGLSDLENVFGLNGGNLIVFNGLVPHQYIYPCGRIGQTNISMRQRCKPGVPVVFDMTGGSPVDGVDTAIALYAANYYRSFGNVGDLHISAASRFTLTAQHLTEFVSNPSSPSNPAFKPSEIVLNCPLIEHLDLEGSAGIGGTLNLSNCIRLRSVNTMGCDGIDDGNGNVSGGIVGIQLPSSLLMTSVELGSRLVNLTLNNLPNLTTLRVIHTHELRTLILRGVGSLGRALVEQCHEENAPLEVLTLTNILWESVRRDFLMWITSLESCTLTGRITMHTAANLSLSDLTYLFGKYGNIRSESNDLYIDYVPVLIERLSITGQKYFTALGQTQFGVATDAGNNLKFVDGKPVLQWRFVKTDSGGNEVEDLDASSYMQFVDDVAGIANVIRLAASGDTTRYRLKVTAELLNDTTISAYWNIGFFNRKPMRGDFAYADGTFDDEYRYDKTVVGFAIRVVDNGSSLTIDVAAKENTVIRSSNGALNTSSLPWGVYPSEDNNGINSTMRSDIQSQSENVSLVSFNTAGSGTGDYDSLAKSANMVNRAKAIIRGWIRNLWGTYDLTIAPYSTERTYVQGNVVLYDSVIYMCKVTSTTAGAFNAASWSTLSQAQYDLLVWAKSRSLSDPYPKNTYELGDMMVALYYLQNALGASAATRFYQLFYPAAYACNMYEPAVKEGETLDVRYARTNWMLPACGMVNKIYGMYHASRNKVSGGSISVNYANEDQELTDANYPLMSNILKRLSDAGENTAKFSLWSNSNFWSASENNTTSSYGVLFQNGNVGVNYTGYKYVSYVVRAVTAFTYTL